MSGANRGGGRSVESAGYEGWTLTGYAWRSTPIKSPLSGDAIRAVVGVDERGRYRPGIRINNPETIASIFDAKPVSNIAGAVTKSREILRSTLIDHARLAAESTQKSGEIVDVRVDARALAIAEGRSQGAVEKYGAGEFVERELPPPRRSR